MKKDFNVRNGFVFVETQVGYTEKCAYRHAIRAAAKLQGKKHESVTIGEDYVIYEVDNDTTFIHVTMHKWIRSYK